MITLPRHILACLLVLFSWSLVPYVHAVESVSPGTSEPAGKAALTSPAVSPPAAEVTEKPTPQLVLSRRDAVAMAVYRNIDLRIEALNFKMAEIEAAKSWGIYNPVFTASGSTGVSATPGDVFFMSRTANASIGLTQSIPTGGSISATTQTSHFSVDNSGTASKDWQATAGLTVNQPLLKNAGREITELNISLAASTQQDSLDRFRATTIETVSNAITAYNHLYVLRQAYETRVAALNSARNLLDEIRKKAAPGAVQGLEIANAEFAIAQRRKDLVDATRSVSDQEVNLRYLVGLDLPTHIIPSDPPSKDEPQETDVQVAKAALENRSDLKQLQLSLKTTQLQERVARRQSWPEFSINAGGGYTGSGFNFGESYQQIGNHPGTFWTVGMFFSIPLGNTTAGNEYIRSRIRTEQVQNQIKALSWRIRNDIESDTRSLISARLQMQLSDVSSQFAEQRLEEYRKNNRLGSATIQDVLNAENDRNFAHNARLEAVESFSNAVTKLWRDAGLLLDRHGIHIDTSHPDKLTDNKEQNPDILVDPPASGSPPASTETAQEQSRNMPTVPLRYTLTIGEYEVKSAMDEAIGMIKKAGFVPIVKSGSTKTKTVIRLYVADYPDQKSALLEIGRLHRLKVDGFIITGKEGKFTVYAGSSSSKKQAGIEQKRLSALGVKTVLKGASVPQAAFMLSVGNFATREEAEENAAKLEKQGLKAAITENID